MKILTWFIFHVYLANINFFALVWVMGEVSDSIAIDLPFLNSFLFIHINAAWLFICCDYSTDPYVKSEILSLYKQIHTNIACMAGWYYFFAHNGMPLSPHTFIYLSVTQWSHESRFALGLYFVDISSITLSRWPLGLVSLPTSGTHCALAWATFLFIYLCGFFWCCCCHCNCSGIQKKL